MRRKKLNLETAVQDDEVTQDFESESLLAEGDHSHKVKAPPARSNYGSKDCVNSSPSTAVSRLKADFTKRKFLSFHKKQQHKQCAELMRCLYESHLQGECVIDLLDTYNSVISWIDIPAIPQPSSQLFADRYHLHAKHAEISHKEHRLLPHVRQGDRKNGEPAWNISVYLDNIRSAHNVGSILRTVEAFSLGKVYFSDETPSASHKQVQDAAMGADKWIDCTSHIPLDLLPKPLIAMETASTSIPLFDYCFPEKFTLVVGNEEYGCSESTLQAADVIIEIPLRGRKNSLNVANAFAIAAAEISRQRIRSPHGR